MKYFFLFLLLISGVCYGQTTYYIQADSVRFRKIGANSDFILENSTRTRTGAYLKNRWNGRTEFGYAVDSGSVSGSDLILWRGNGTQNITLSGIGVGYTFENGLTESPVGTVKWGGSLTGNTTIRGQNATRSILMDSLSSFSARVHEVSESGVYLFNINKTLNYILNSYTDPNVFAKTQVGNDDPQNAYVIIQANKIGTGGYGIASQIWEATDSSSTLSASKLRFDVDSSTAITNSGIRVNQLKTIPSITNMQLVYRDSTTGFIYRGSGGGGGGITSFTDGGGFDGTVTGSALSLISTVTNDQYVYSNSGALTGSTLLTRDATNSAVLINGATVPDASFDLGITGSFLAGVTQRFIVVPEGAALGSIPAGARFTSNSGTNLVIAPEFGQGSITTKGVYMVNYNGSGFASVLEYVNGAAAKLNLVKDGGETIVGASTDNGAFTLQNNGAFYTQTVNVAVITATDGDATIAATTGFEILPTISANRNVTFPAQSAGKTITVWNKNSAGFAWDIVGTVIDAADNAITALVNDTMYTFISDGTSWVKKN